MQKSTFTPLYGHFRSRLVRMRLDAGLTQRDLAKRLGREHSFVSRMELGDRRIDTVEFFWICKACNRDPRIEMAVLAKEFRRIEASRKKFANA